MIEYEGRPGIYTIDSGNQRVMATTISPIPEHPLIVKVLNTTLATQFNLGASMAYEGGLDGTYKEDRVDLTNLSDLSPSSRGERVIGLWNNCYSWYTPNPPGEGLSEILNLYTTMLKDLFDGHHGDILTDRAFNASEQVGQALMGMLKCKVGSDAKRQIMQNSDALNPYLPLLKLLKRRGPKS